jgi:hypothetical protein
MLIGVRLHPPELARLDGWAETQVDKPSRPKALWRLAERGLAAESAAAKPRRPAKAPAGGKK